MKIHLIRVLLGVVLLTSACSPTSTSKVTWQSIHLRALDAPDAAEPSQDLVAVYTQIQPNQLWLRLDLLETGDLPDFDLYLAFDWASQGTRRLPIEGDSLLAWELLLVIPARGEIQVLGPSGQDEDFSSLAGYRVLVMRDPTQDTLEIRLQTSRSAGELADLLHIWNANLEVLLTQPGAPQIADRLVPISLNAPPPSPVPTLLAFWNTLPAYTPLQALRRWDGAHSGPSGGRHGLSGLLQAAERTRSPLFLLDLNQPAAFAALQLLGATTRIQDLAAAGLLYLPQVIPALSAHPEMNPPPWVLQEFLRQETALSQHFELSTPGLYFLPGGESSLSSFNHSTSQSDAPILWIPSSQDQSAISGTPFRSRLENHHGERIISLPPQSLTSPEHQQATPDGLALESRRALIQAAIETQASSFRSTLVILGGDLAQSNWGNPQMARTTLLYIQNHPWIRLVDLEDMRHMASPLDPPYALSEEREPTWQPAWLEDLRQAPPNPLTQSAWQAYRALYNPLAPGDRKLGQLRAHYAGQISILVRAARWAADTDVISQSFASCAEDPDLDGQVECILSSADAFAVIELDLGGYLSFLFVRDGLGEVHQLVAPSSLLTSGLSPSSTWDISQGILADPRVLPGAFVEMGSINQTQATPAISDHQVTLDVPDRSVSKKFTLLPDGIQLTLIGNPTGQTQSMIAALTLDPWHRFQTDWEPNFQMTQSVHYLRFDAPGGPGFELSSDAALFARTTFEQLERLRHPENPDRDIPPGHMFPFPIAVVELHGEAPYSVILRLAGVK